MKEKRKEKEEIFLVIGHIFTEIFSRIEIHLVMYHSEMVGSYSVIQS
jgi:hypothetical protein